MTEQTHDTSERSLLLTGAVALGLTLSDHQLSQIVLYRSLLLDANRHINLTAITDPRLVLTRHMLDSLTTVLAIPVHSRGVDLRIIDVGSGAGFPGLVLAILYPHWRVTLLESIGKKTAFLESVCHALELPHITIVTGRSEELGRDPHHRDGYHVAVARAVATLPVLLEYLLPFCRTDGRAVALKKGDIANEVAGAEAAALSLGGSQLEQVGVPKLPDLGTDRVVVVSEKLRRTPAAYPRRVGVPAKDPLR